MNIYLFDKTKERDGSRFEWVSSARELLIIDIKQSIKSRLHSQVASSEKNRFIIVLCLLVRYSISKIVWGVLLQKSHTLNGVEPKKKLQHFLSDNTRSPHRNTGEPTQIKNQVVILMGSLQASLWLMSVYTVHRAFPLSTP